jgi:hypothetical protein
MRSNYRRTEFPEGWIKNLLLLIEIKPVHGKIPDHYKCASLKYSIISCYCKKILLLSESVKLPKIINCFVLRGILHSNAEQLKYFTKKELRFYFPLNYISFISATLI